MGAGSEQNIQRARFDVTIASGATGLSTAVDLSGYALEAIEMPATWVAAVMTFQAAATSGGTYKKVTDEAGSEISFAAAASIIMAVPPLKIPRGLQFIKLRSGTAAAPVDQTASRTITLHLRHGD